MRGPPPKPTWLRVLEGNPGRRPLNAREPRPPSGVVRMPRHLSPAAKAAWRAWAPRLRRMRLLTVADGPALECLCETYAELRAARDTLQVEGRYQGVATKAGGTMVRLHPAVGDVQDADRRLRGWLAEFGLTPAQRSRVRVPPEHVGKGEAPAQDPAWIRGQRR